MFTVFKRKQTTEPALNKELKIRLWAELYSRSGLAVLVGQSVLAGIIAAAYQKGIYPQVSPAMTYLLGVVLFSAIRYLLSFSPPGNSTFSVAYNLNLILLGSCWGWLNSYAVTFYGFDGANMTITLLGTAGIIAGATTALSPVPTAFHVYSASLITPLIAALWQKSVVDDRFWFLFGSVTVYAIFLISHGRTLHRSLRTAVLQSFELETEKTRLESLLNAVTGHVFLIDTDLQYSEVILTQTSSKELLEPNRFIKQTVGFRVPQSEFVTKISEFMASPLRDMHTEILGCEILKAPEDHWFYLTAVKMEIPKPGALIILLPIDDLKQAQAELEQQKARSEYASKLATLGEMAGGIAHEINNPLAVISAAAETIFEENTHEKPNKELIERMVSQINKVTMRISKIVKGLRTFSRQGDRDPILETDLNSILKDTLSLCQNKFDQAEVKLTLKIPEGLSLDCRPVQLSQVFLNLLGNSLDAIQEGNHSPKWVEVRAKTEEDQVVLKFIDCGLGIPLEARKRIFDPFYTTKEIGKGTGLGLSISIGIIQDHGGTLTLDDSAHNTTFVIRLPKRQAKKAPLSQAS